jgi:putative RNA 2'-phosphotransferase
MDSADQTPDTDDTPDAPLPSLNEAEAGRLSRFLSLILRHRAPHFGLDMDDEGFVNIDDLLDVIDEQQPALDWVEPEHLTELAGRGDRRRFEVRDDRVRATYGHSFSRPIHYKNVDPPEILYVGIPKSQMTVIRSDGLRPHGRQYVHLSVESEEAMQVGRNQDAAAELVRVKAAEAATAGIAFHHPANGLYLVAGMPPKYLDLGDVSFGRTTRRGSRRR